MKIEWEKCPISQFLKLTLKSFQIRRVCAKKSIIIHDLNSCQKLPGIILVTSINFILKYILVKVPFWAKTMVPYESQKREKIHISYIVHPRKIWLTESRGSRSFFILKSGVHFSFWAIFNFAYRVPGTFNRIVPTNGPVLDFDFPFFSYTMGPSFMPHIHFWRYSQKKSNHILACSYLGRKPMVHVK